MLAFTSVNQRYDLLVWAQLSWTTSPIMHPMSCDSHEALHTLDPHCTMGDVVLQGAWPVGDNEDANYMSHLAISHKGNVKLKFCWTDPNWNLSSQFKIWMFWFGWFVWANQKWNISLRFSRWKINIFWQESTFFQRKLQFWRNYIFWQKIIRLENSQSALLWIFTQTLKKIQKINAAIQI